MNTKSRGGYWRFGVNSDVTTRLILIVGFVTLFAIFAASISHTGKNGSFKNLLATIEANPDEHERLSLVSGIVDDIKKSGTVVMEDSVVFIVYQGAATSVSVPSDLNGWNPARDTMKNIPSTDFFYHSITIDPRARFEYKLVVDSVWMLDPLNPQRAVGGYGPNSEIWMPLYSPPKEIEYRVNIPHGRVDTLVIESKHLKRSHTTFIYTPPQFSQLAAPYPVVFVTDGGEYLSLAFMANVIDNLIADKRIPPIIAVFVDPRTDITNSETSQRMTDYSMSDPFLSFIIEEVRKPLVEKYNLTTKGPETAIMGASLGGLISTYASMKHPDLFGLSAAQSPAYWWKNEEIFPVVERQPTLPVRFYIDTGTIRDAQEHASRMRDLLLGKGYEVAYAEYPEGHNWVNWRARLDEILTFFWGNGR